MESLLQLNNTPRNHIRLDNMAGPQKDSSARERGEHQVEHNSEQLFEDHHRSLQNHSHQSFKNGIKNRTNFIANG